MEMNLPKRLLQLYTVGVIFMFIVSVASFILDPFGRLILSYNDFTISSVTMMTFTFFILVLLYAYNHINPLPRILCTLGMPVFAISFDEALYHYGIWRIYGPGTCLFEFWVFYSALLAFGIIYLHMKYNILKSSTLRLSVFFVLLGLYLGSWNYVYNEAFYIAIIKWCQGLGPDPHKPINYIIPTLGNLMWLVFSKIPSIGIILSKILYTNTRITRGIPRGGGAPHGEEAEDEVEGEVRSWSDN